MDVVAMISNLAGAAKEWLGFQSKELDLKNTAPVQQAKIAQNTTTEQDAVAQAIAQKDADEIRKHIAE